MEPKSTILPWRSFLDRVFGVLDKYPEMSMTYIYDWACTRLDNFQEKLNICDWHKGLHGPECIRYYNPCCEIGGVCHNLTTEGCSIKSLTCKLWLCDLANSKLQRIIIDKSHPLRETALSYMDFRFKVMTFFHEVNVPLISRASKDETFNPTNNSPELSNEWDWLNQDLPILKGVDLSKYKNL